MGKMEEKAKGIINSLGNVADALGIVDEAEEKARKEQERLNQTAEEAIAISKRRAQAYDEEAKAAKKQAAEVEAVQKLISKMGLTKDKGMGSFFEIPPKNVKTFKDLREEIEKVQKSAKAGKEGLSSAFAGNLSEKQLKKVTDAEKAFGESLNKTTKQAKTTKATNDALTKSVGELAEAYKKLGKAITEGGEMRVHINNAGFERVLNEYSKAIDNFHARNKRKGKDGNFFDELVKEKVVPTPETAKETAQTSMEKIEDAFKDEKVFEGIGKAIKNSLKDTIVENVKEGIKAGFKVTGPEMIVHNLGDIQETLKKRGARPSTIASAMEGVLKYGNMTGAQKVQMNKTDQAARVQIENKKAELNAEAAEKRAIRNAEERAEQKRHEETMEHIRGENRLREIGVILQEGGPDAAKKIANQYAAQEKQKANSIKLQNKSYEAAMAFDREKENFQRQMMAFQLAEEEENLKKKRAWSSRKEAVMTDYTATDVMMQERMNQLQGKELTNMDKALEKMTHLLGIRKEIEDKAEDGVRMTASQIKNWQDLNKQVREIAKEQYNVQSGYYKQNEALEKALKQTQSFDQKLQAIGNTIAGLTRTWNTFGNAIHSIFGRVRNRIMNLFATGRNEMRTLVNEATEQYSKLETAQIGFKNFFGAEKAQKLVKQIEKEAIAAPALSAGDLADYVAALAPVSQGNSDLALNATLGVLKSIQYSGGDASTEMSRVVANIRDVTAKGKANTIDIRQFQRAMPAIEKALEELGASEFLQNGSLTITPENAKTLVEAFARLNTDVNSPVRNIFKQISNTLEGLSEAFRERKTQAMVNVLKNSGAFDLAKDVLGDVSENGMIGRVEAFFTKILKNVVDWIKSVDWDDVGKRFSKAWQSIKETIVTLKKEIFGGKDKDGNDIKGMIPGIDGWKAFEVFINAVKKFIQGFGEGLKLVINIVKNITSNFSPEIIEKAASVMGFMMSPVFKLFSTVGSFATSVLSAAQNLNKTLSKFQATRLEKYNKAVEKYAEGFANMYVGGANTMEYYKGFNNINYDAKSGTFTGYETMKNGKVKVTKGLTLTPAGFLTEKELETYKGLTFSERAYAYTGYGKEGATAKTKIGAKAKYAGAQVGAWANNAMANFAAQINKIVMGGELLLLGQSLNAAVDSTDKFGKALTTAISGIGITMASVGIGKSIGGLFGPIGGQIGGTIGGIAGTLVSIYTTVDAWYQAENAKQAKEAAEKKANARNDLVKNTRRSVMDALGLNENETESARYVYNQLTEMLNNSSDADITGDGKYGNTEQMLKHFFVQGQLELNRFYRSDFLEQLDDFVGGKDDGELSADAKAFHAATGKVYSNWGDDADAETRGVRKFIADMVRDHGLLSDGQVAGGSLKNASEQAIVEAFLKDMDGTINEGQVKILKDKLNEANEKFPNDANKIRTALQNNTTQTDKLTSNIGALNENVETIIKEGIKLRQNTDEQPESGDGMTNEEYAAARSRFGDDWWTQMKDISFNLSAAKRWYQNDYNDGQGMFDEGTKSVLHKGDLSGAHSNAWRQGSLWKISDDSLKEMEANLDGKNYIDFIFDNIAAISKKAQARLNADDASEEEKSQWMQIIDLMGQAYKYIDSIGSFRNLSAEESQAKMYKLISGLTLIAPGLIKKNWEHELLGLDASSLWKAIFKAAGGSIFRAGGGRGVDTVPAYLQPGEFVMRRGSVNKAGLGVMAALNRGDLAAAARGLGAKLINGGNNNSRNWTTNINNNQRTNNNVFNILNRNMSARMSTYSSLANRIAAV